MSKIIKIVTPMRTASRLRHWKQKFNPKAKFIWAKHILYNGQMTIIGAEIPQILIDNPNKVRRFWESKHIQLADFTAPNVFPEFNNVETIEGIAVPKGISVKKLKGSWHLLTSVKRPKGIRVNGKIKLEKVLKAMVEEL